MHSDFSYICIIIVLLLLLWVDNKQNRLSLQLAQLQHEMKELKAKYALTEEILYATVKKVNSFEKKDMV